MRQHIKDDYEIHEGKRGVGWQEHFIPTYSSNRHCKYCGKELSKYNPNKRACFIHSARARLDYSTQETTDFHKKQKSYRDRAQRKTLVV